MNKQSKHYKICKPEAIELIDRYHLNFNEGNIIKYILRSPFKGDRVGDLKKALYYAKKLPKECKLTWDNRDRGKFDIDELDKYLDSHALYAIEVDAVASIIQGNFSHTVTHDRSGRRIASYKENYIENLIETAIDAREHDQKIEESIGKNIKEFNPDWLPPHPLNTLLDLIDEDPKAVLDKLDQILEKAITELRSEFYVYSIIFIRSLIIGDHEEIKLLSKIGGSKEFWKNRYDNYWEKRNQSVTK